MRNIAIIILVFLVNVANAQDINEEGIAPRQTFCVTIAKLATTIMVVRSERQKSQQEVEEAYRPVINMAERKFGRAAAKMLREQLSQAYEDDEEEPDKYGREAYRICKEKLNVVMNNDPND